MCVGGMILMKQLAESPRIECSRKSDTATITECALTMSHEFEESNRPATSFVPYIVFKHSTRFTRGCFRRKVHISVSKHVRAKDCAGGSNIGMCAARIVIRRRRFTRDETRTRTGETDFRHRSTPDPTPDTSTNSNFVGVPSNVSRRLPFGWIKGRVAVVTCRGKDEPRNKFGEENPTHEEGGIYIFYNGRGGRVSCGSITGLGGCISREKGVLPEEVAKGYTGRRETLAMTVGETERVSLVPCIRSWLEWLTGGGVRFLRGFEGSVFLLFSGSFLRGAACDVLKRGVLW